MDSWDELDQIRPLDGPARETAIENFLTRRIKLCRAHSRQSVERFGKSQYSRYLDPTYAVILETLWTMAVRYLEDCDRALAVSRLRGYSFEFEFAARARRAAWDEIARIRHYTDRGAIAVRRRSTEVARARNTLERHLGRTPTLKEILTEANRRLSTTRKDPHRQGMIITLSDCVSPIAPLDPNQEDTTATDSSAGGGELAARIIAACQTVSLRLGKAASGWVEAVAAGQSPEGVLISVINAADDTRRRNLTATKRAEAKNLVERIVQAAKDC